MPNWDRWIEEDGVPVSGGRSRGKKPSKNFYCRKNKFGGGQYGPHEYKEGGHVCVKCGHIKDKSPKTDDLNEREDKHEQRDE